MLSLSCFEFFVGIGAFVIRLSHIASLFSEPYHVGFDLRCIVGLRPKDHPRGERTQLIILCRVMVEESRNSLRDKKVSDLFQENFS